MPQKDSKIFQYSFLKFLMDIKRAASDNEPVTTMLSIHALNVFKTSPGHGLL